MNNCQKFLLDKEVNISQKIRIFEIIDYSFSCKNDLFIDNFQDSSLWELLRMISKSIIRKKTQKVLEVFVVDTPAKKSEFVKFVKELLRKIKKWSVDMPLTPKEEETEFLMHQNKIEKYLNHKKNENGNLQQSKQMLQNEVNEEEYNKKKYTPINSKIDRSLPANVYFTMAFSVGFFVVLTV